PAAFCRRDGPVERGRPHAERQPGRGTGEGGTLGSQALCRSRGRPGSPPPVARGPVRGSHHRSPGPEPDPPAPLPRGGGSSCTPAQGPSLPPKPRPDGRGGRGAGEPEPARAQGRDFLAGRPRSEERRV